MKFPTLGLFTASLVFGSLATPLLHAADAAKPNADTILHEMSAQLAGAHRFRLHAHRQIDGSLCTANDLPADAQITVTVERPNKVTARTVSKGDVREFYANGQTLTQVDVTNNLYAVVPMHTSIDGLVVELKQKYGFTPPLAELTISDVYRDIRRKTQSISYRGEAVIGSFLGVGGVICHHLSLSGQGVDADFWVGVSDHLPRRLIATEKTRPGHPQIRLAISDWDLAANVTPQEFTYTPPKGAMKITMTTVDDMCGAHRKH